MGQFYTLDGKSLCDLGPNGFTYLNISEVILVKGKKWTLEPQSTSSFNR
jgi:hypothetical protein